MTYQSSMSHSELMAALARVRHVALDMDGTIYLGSRLFDFTKGFLQSLTQLGIGYSFLTNNPTRSITDYLTKLAGLGIDATPEQMYTTSTATIEYIKATMSGVRTLFVVGTPSMEAEFRNAGFELTACNAASLPDALVVAFDTTLTYDKMCRAAYLAQQGVPYIATNPDRVCPTDLSTVLPDCGSLCKAIEYATGRKPDIVIGKPNPDMLTGIRRRHGLAPEEIAMCGDRIYTDVAMAFNAGALGVLVLSGETTLDTALAAERMPDVVARDIAAFGSLLREARGL